MAPSQQCKSAGLESLRELSKYSATSEQTLINWHRDQPQKFKCMLAGAVREKLMKELREQKPVKDAYIDEHGVSVGISFIDSNRAIPASWKPLYASAPVPASAGWKLVPIEPTEEMQAAAEKVGSPYDAYKAMLEAAPKEQA